MKNNKFNKTRLATSLSLVLSATAFTSAPVFAEEGADTEVIKVKGIRGSLMRSVDLKRSAAGIVDAISAEDMGKFPDTNLAESLQRITGVSIDRSNGEGSKVTVRGVGPDNNLVLLNGRQMPTANINATSASDSRSFDFANLASEGVAAVEVYKSGKADIATGGLGATINLTSFKPLNNPGTKLSVGVKAVHDTSTDSGDSVTPEFSGLFSQTFADDKIGIAVVASYQNRQNGAARAEAGNGWRPFSATQDATWGTLPDAPADGSADPNHLNRPSTGIYAVPQNMLYGFKEVERTRTNGQLTLQFRPFDELTATLDYTYSKNDVDVNQNIHSVWMNFGHTSSQWTDTNSEGVAAPIVITENNTGVAGDEPPFGHAKGDLTFADLVSQVEQSGQVNENKSVGFNLEYQANDNLKFTLDYHSSSAEAKPNTIYGNSNTIQMATNIRGETTIDFSSEFPVVSVKFPAEYSVNDFDDATAHPLSDVSGLEPDRVRTTGTSFRNSYMKSEIDQLQVKGKWTFDSGIVESIDFGIGNNVVENRNAYAFAERATWGGVGQYDDVPNELLEASRSTMVERFDNLPGDKSNMINEFWAPDFEAIAKIVGEKYGDPSDPQTWPCGTTICAPSKYQEDRRTKEESVSAYVQSKLVFDLGPMPATIYAGVRYEETDVISTTLLPEVLRIGWIADNEFTIERGTEDVFATGKGSYDYILPNLDLQLEVVEDLFVKASASKTISRPGYGNLTAGGRVNEARYTGVKGARGNPGLLPIESTNLDLSVEFYYGEGSYVSVGYFDKKIDGFVSVEEVNDTLPGVFNPAAGERFNDAVAVVGPNDPAAVRAEILKQNPADGVYIEEANSTTGEAAKIWGHPTENAVLEVTYTQPVNSGGKNLDGFELAIQHLFGDSGFGLIANATIVDGDLTYDNSSLEPQEAPLIGLSDSYNLVGFYDKDGLQIRLAYNWRDSFLKATSDASVTHNPIYTQDYGQLDANVSFDINENFTVFAEAINVTDEYTRDHGRHQLMTYLIEQTGTRYNFGARYTF
ncbi:TonB-dependent receptor [Catenovulum agarivorans DS-2]|uniref:TonB-dependent receptor n=1 Tax=Catenovulum agarivorans DS-2 TaxID=1328313 RepID=W7QUF8_9ALTE|nr:TonB-dependent receptor [Catenovulum agarivorans]EWH11493.1 TonB-dependent receptor [Catenovulum agarivorans DS-2]